MFECIDYTEAANLLKQRNIPVPLEEERCAVSELLGPYRVAINLYADYMPMVPAAGTFLDAALGDWDSVIVCRRRGLWEFSEYDGLTTMVQKALLQSIEIPAEASECYYMHIDRASRRELYLLIFLCALDGNALYDDLYIIPLTSPARAIQVDHHGAMYFRTDSQCHSEAVKTALEARDYPVGFWRKEDE